MSQLNVDTIATAAGTEQARLVQVVNEANATMNTTTTASPPLDDTLPQNDEGGEFLTAEITPTNSNNKLLIEVDFPTVSHSVANANFIISLFKDSDADAIASSYHQLAFAGGGKQSTLRYYMTAGTTSAITFKVRAGSSTSGTVTINGLSSTRYLGGALKRSMTISEIRA